MNITTKTGDGGITDIIGERVDKSCDIICLLGDLDESASVIALLRSHIKDDRAKKELSDFISHITHIAGCVSMKKEVVDQDMISKIESDTDYYQKKNLDIKMFSYPDKSLAALADYARCVIRRAERAAVRCKINIVFLNRLSDYLFVLSRYIETGDIT